MTFCLNHCALECGCWNVDLFFQYIYYYMLGSKVHTLCEILDILALYPLCNSNVIFLCNKYFLIWMFHLCVFCVFLARFLMSFSPFTPTWGILEKIVAIFSCWSVSVFVVFFPFSRCLIILFGYSEENYSKT